VARLWNVASAQAFGQPLAHRGPVTAAAFSGDGRTVLTGSADGTARLWDAAGGRSLGPPLPHSREVTFVGFSPDGQGVLTAGGLRSLQRWQAPVPPLAGDPERIKLWAEVVTGLELESDTVVGALSRQAWCERRQRLRELGGPPLP
jgi:WD40 repeat protein